MNLRNIAAVLTVLLFVTVGVHNVVDNRNKLELKNIQLKSTATELKTLELKYDNLQIELDKTGKDNTQKIQELEKQKQQLEQERAKLQQELSAKKASKLQVAATSIPTQGTASAASGCGSDPYMAYIYQHESGCSTTALNSIGCRGIAQACPGSKLPCGADFTCQDIWFKAYAIQRYGSTYNAYVFWLGNHWW